MQTDPMRAILTYIVFLLIICSCSRRIEKTTPVIGNITESVYAAGTVKAKNQYEVYANVSGIIRQILVSENDLVKRGEPLLVITDETRGLGARNAMLAADHSAMRANSDKLRDMKNSIAIAESKMKNDSLLYKRQQNLWAQDIGSRMQLEEKELAYRNACNALNSLQARYNDLLREISFNSRYATNNAMISRYKEGDFVIRSTVDGKVYSLSREPGEMVSPQAPLAVIGDAGHFYLELQIDEYDIVKIAIGKTVLISMDSYKGKVFEATVSKINPIMNERTKSFTVEAEFITRPPVLYPNLTAEANIIIESRKKTMMIPRNYLIDDSVVVTAKNKKKTIVTGLKDFRMVEVVKGLTADDVIYKPD